MFPQICLLLYFSGQLHLCCVNKERFLVAGPFVMVEIVFCLLPF